MSNKIISLLFICMLCSTNAKDTQNPEMEIHMSEIFVDYIIQISTIRGLRNMFEDMEIEDVQKAKHLNFLGDLSYQLKDMKMANFVPPIVKTNMEDGIVEMQIRRLSIDVTGKYKMKYLYISTSGSFTDRMCLNMNLTLAPGKSSGLDVLGCEAKAECGETLEIQPNKKLPNWAQNILNIAATEIASSILSRQVCKDMESHFSNKPCYHHNNCIATAKLVPTLMQFQLNLPWPIQVTNLGLTSYATVDITLDGFTNLTQSKWATPPIPKVPLTSAEVTIIFTSSPFSSAVDMYCKAGLLDRIVDTSKFSGEDSLPFATCCHYSGHCFGSFNKDICDKYKNKFLKVSLKPTGVLSNVITDSDIITTVNVNANFTLNGTLQLSARFNLSTTIVPYVLPGNAVLRGNVTSVRVIPTWNSNEIYADLLGSISIALNRTHFNPTVKDIAYKGINMNGGSWRDKILSRIHSIKMMKGVLILGMEFDVTFKQKALGSEL